MINSSRTKPRQAQLRSVITRQKLVDATIDLLWERGYQGSSIAAISARAGVTHGAHLHHFGTREDLLTASVDALFQRSVAEYELRMSDLPEAQPDRIDAVFNQLHAMAMGRIFDIVSELLLASRTNPELETRMLHYSISQRQLQHRMYEWAFGEKLANDKQFFQLLDATFSIYLRGLSTLKKTRSLSELDEAWQVWKFVVKPVLLERMRGLKSDSSAEQDS